MNSISRPAYEMALETTIDALRAIKADGAEQPAMLATLKAKMFNEEFLEKQHRQTFLKRVNETLGSNYSMNQVRKADPTLLIAAAMDPTVLEGTLIAVDELHGEVTLETPAMSTDKEWVLAAAGNNDTLQLLDTSGPVVNTDPKAHSPELVAFILDLSTHKLRDSLPESRLELYNNWINDCHPDRLNDLESARRALPDDSHDDQFFAFIGTDKSLWASFKDFVIAAQNADTPAPAVQLNTQTSNTSSEQQTMNTAANVSPINTASTENTAQPKSAFQLFIDALVVQGFATEVERDALYNAFLAGNLQFQPIAQASSNAGQPGLSNDAQFYAFVSSNAAVDEAFKAFLPAFKQAQPQVVSAEDRSRFSFRGERDEGVRSGWVAAGSALLGAALETGHRGEISIGSGLGAVAGIVGSYFAAELLDKHIDNQFGRYVAAGTLGLAAGSLGSGAGRLAQGAIQGSVAQQSEGIPSLPAPVMSGTPVVHPSVAAMLGLF